MTNNDGLPDGWIVGDYVNEQEMYFEPRQPSEEGFRGLIGWDDAEDCHRYFTLPKETSVIEIVEVFQVGSHGAESYGYEVAGTVSLVADKGCRRLCCFIFAERKFSPRT